MLTTGTTSASPPGLVTVGEKLFIGKSRVLIETVVCGPYLSPLQDF